MGTVYLIGAGPGDPELLTVRGARLLSRSDAVVYDALTNEALLDVAPPEALRIDVGKRSGGRGPSQEEINELLVRLAPKSDVVALALRESGVPFEIVPGITAGLGVLAYAGIPVTHRGLSSSVTFVTGHQATGNTAESGVDWNALAAVGGTVVVYMGLSKIDAVAERLLEGGRSPTTPAAVIESGTYDRQRTIVGELGTIAELSRRADAGKPALIVIGEVVRLQSAIAWFENAASDRAGLGPDVPLVPVGREVG